MSRIWLISTATSSVQGPSSLSWIYYNSLLTSFLLASTLPSRMILIKLKSGHVTLFKTLQWFLPLSKRQSPYVFVEQCLACSGHSTFVEQMNGSHFKETETECFRECIVSVVYAKTMSSYLALHQKIDK